MSVSGADCGKRLTQPSSPPAGAQVKMLMYVSGVTLSAALMAPALAVLQAKNSAGTAAASAPAAAAVS
jgi:hypothetical protein